MKNFWFWFGMVWLFCGAITLCRSLYKSYGLWGSFYFAFFGPIANIVVAFIWVKDKIDLSKYRKK